MTVTPDDVLRIEPDADADPATLTYTFGGAKPVVSIRPGTVVSTWTMDCFAGRVNATTDLVSEVCDPRFINPQTGPFYVEGAAPGDTLAVHFRSITPRYARGVSTTVPLFGSLDGNPVHRDAARPPSGADVGLRDRRRGRRRALRRTRLAVPGRPAARSHARHRRRRTGRSERCAPRSLPATGAATWTPRRCAPGRPATSASTSRERCSASVTATPGRARARRAASPSSARWTPSS